MIAIVGKPINQLVTSIMRWDKDIFYGSLDLNHVLQIPPISPETLTITVDGCKILQLVDALYHYKSQFCP